MSYIVSRPVLLRPSYHFVCKRPLEYRSIIGFPSRSEELELVDELGINMIHIGSSFVQSLIKEDKTPSIRLKDIDQLERISSECEKKGLALAFTYLTCTNWTRYPEWFVELFPDMFSLDQNGCYIEVPFLGGFWTSVDHPILNELKACFIREVISHFKNLPNLKFWTMDGETFYPTYFYRNRWTDYNPYSIKHFDEWLKARYKQINSLNEACALGMLSSLSNI